jgi:hypothetical protein
MLFAVLLAGEYALHGFTNRDVQTWGSPPFPFTERRQATEPKSLGCSAVSMHKGLIANHSLAASE